MKLNDQQTNLIKQLVDRDVKYSDTYIEVYDHLITALERLPLHDDITTAYDAVIEQDFGGQKGLAKLEDDYKKAYWAHLHRNKWDAMLAYLKWPLLPGTILVTCFVFYITTIPGNREYTTPAIIGALFGPISQMLIPRLMTRPADRDAKKTIRYGTLRHMGLYIGTLYTALLICAYFANLAVHHYKLINNTSLSYPILITTYFVFGMLHNIAIFKNYREVYNLPTYDFK